MKENDLYDSIKSICNADINVSEASDQLVLRLAAKDWLSVAIKLRDDLHFNQLVDLCGVDYLHYGLTEWQTNECSGSGFSRGVNRVANNITDNRFVVVVHLLSTIKNYRLRVHVILEEVEPPLISSCVKIWPSANWFEREAFDLFGIVFEGHPDLRRILTDYGFTGHPFRKDFPLTGKVELKYDHSRKRCVYQPCEVEMRVTVPKVIRQAVKQDDSGGK